MIFFSGSIYQRRLFFQRFHNTVGQCLQLCLLIRMKSGSQRQTFIQYCHIL